MYSTVVLEYIKLKSSSTVPVRSGHVCRVTIWSRTLFYTMLFLTYGAA